MKKLAGVTDQLEPPSPVKVHPHEKGGAVIQFGQRHPLDDYGLSAPHAGHLSQLLDQSSRDSGVAVADIKIGATGQRSGRALKRFLQVGIEHAGGRAGGHAQCNAEQYQAAPKRVPAPVTQTERSIQRQHGFLP